MRHFFGVVVMILGSVLLATAQALTVKEIGAEAERMLQEGRFKELDRQASDYIRQDLRLPGGNAAVYHFYGALGSFAGGSAYGYESKMSRAQKDELLTRWLATIPSSVSARIALGEFWSNDAWVTRGYAYSRDIPETTWKAFQWRMNQARTYLDAVKATDDPHFYFVRIDVAKGMGERALMDSLYASGQKRFPSYYHYYSQRALLLQPKWFGAPGAVAQYVKSLHAQPGGVDGQVAYSFASASLLGVYGSRDVLKDTGLNWPLVKEAYAVRQKRYGLRNKDWNTLCNLALAAADRPAAKEALTQFGTEWDPAVWRDRKYFDSAVEWIQRQ